MSGTLSALCLPHTVGFGIGSRFTRSLLISDKFFLTSWNYRTASVVWIREWAWKDSRFTVAVDKISANAPKYFIPIQNQGETHKGRALLRLLWSWTLLTVCWSATCIPIPESTFWLLSSRSVILLAHSKAPITGEQLPVASTILERDALKSHLLATRILGSPTRETLNSFRKHIILELILTQFWHVGGRFTELL